MHMMPSYDPALRIPRRHCPGKQPLPRPLLARMPVLAPEGIRWRHPWQSHSPVFLVQCPQTRFPFRDFFTHRIRQHRGAGHLHLDFFNCR